MIGSLRNKKKQYILMQKRDGTLVIQKYILRFTICSEENLIINQVPYFIIVFLH